MDPIAVTAALLRNQLPDVTIREGASLMARVASKGDSHAVIVIAGIPVTAKLPPEVQAGATLKLKVQEVTPERVTLQIEPQQPGQAAPAAQPAAQASPNQVIGAFTPVAQPVQAKVEVEERHAAEGRTASRRTSSRWPSRRPRWVGWICGWNCAEIVCSRRSRPLPGVRTTSPTRALSVYAPHWKRQVWTPRSRCALDTSRSIFMPDPKVTAALKYTGDGAPQVVAAGKGHLAASILERAHEAGVPVHRDPALASALAQLSLGQEVPEAMWTAVAEVLAWAYGLSGKGPTPNR